MTWASGDEMERFAVVQWCRACLREADIAEDGVRITVKCRHHFLRRRSTYAVGVFLMQPVHHLEEFQAWLTTRLTQLAEENGFDQVIRLHAQVLQGEPLPARAAHDKATNRNQPGWTDTSWSDTSFADTASPPIEPSEGPAPP